MGTRTVRYCDFSDIESLALLTVTVTVQIQHETEPYVWELDIHPWEGMAELNEFFQPLTEMVYGEHAVIVMGNGDGGRLPQEKPRDEPEPDTRTVRVGYIPPVAQEPITQSPPGTVTKTAARPDPKVVRAWARANGWPKLGERGVIAQQIWDAYADAHA